MDYRYNRLQTDKRLMDKQTTSNLTEKKKLPEQRWVEYNVEAGDGIPEGALVLEVVNGKHHFVARHKGSEDIPTFIGPFIQGEGLHRVPGIAGRGPPLKSCELLIDENKSFFPHPLESGTKLPSDKIPVETTDGKNIFIGKMEGIGIGTVRLNQTWQFYSHERDSPYPGNFTVLCFK